MHLFYFKLLLCQHMYDNFNCVEIKASMYVMSSNVYEQLHLHIHKRLLTTANLTPELLAMQGLHLNICLVLMFCHFIII